MNMMLKFAIIVLQGITGLVGCTLARPFFYGSTKALYYNDFNKKLYVSHTVQLNANLTPAGKQPARIGISTSA